MGPYGTNFKQSATARKKAKTALRRSVETDERQAKAEVRRREGFRCRFPRCGCKALRLRLEVAHTQGHKGGRGWEAKRQLSTAANMVLVCTHRHQHGRISLHAGTLEIEPITARGCNGPIRWRVSTAALAELIGVPVYALHEKDPGWLTVYEEAREPGGKPFELPNVLAALGQMDA